MRRLCFLFLALLILALGGCDQDSPLESTVDTTFDATPVPAGEAGYVIDHHELADKIDPLGGQVDVLVILANYVDTPAWALLTESNRVMVDGYMFPDQGDGYSVAELYTEMSFGNTTIDGTTVGPYTIASSIADDCTDYGAWGDEAYAAALADGIDMGLYDVFVYVYPNGNQCDVANQWGGVAYNGNMNGIFKWQGISNYSHELGHLYGMKHSATPEGGEYGDLSCMMASSWGFDQWMPLHQVNAYWKYRMGWFEEAEILTIDGPGVYTAYLAPTERAAGSIIDPPGADAHQLLIIDTGSLPNPETLQYVSFRQAEGYDDHPLLDSFNGRVHVHTRSSWNSNRMAMLEAGQSYTAGPIVITAETDGRNGEDWVQVTVEVIEPQCDTCFDSTLTPEYVYAQTQPKYFATGWTLTVTNNDDEGCANGSYDVHGSCSYPDLEFGSNFDMTVAPGETGSTPLILQPLATLPEGVYPFSVSVVENGGCTESANYIRYFVLDGTAPTAPTDCHAQMTLNESAIITWTASSDAHAGVDHYEVWCNDALVGIATGTTFEHQGVQWNYRYTYEVRALDKAGNVSGWSNASTIGCRKCPIPQVY